MNSEIDSENHDAGDELRKIAGNNSFFKAPEGYFDSLHARIAAKRSVTVSAQPRLAVILYTGMVAAILFGAAFFFSGKKNAGREQQSAFAESIAETTMIAAIDEQILLEAIELPATDEESQVIYDYLIDNHTELNLITSAL